MAAVAAEAVDVWLAAGAAGAAAAEAAAEAGADRPLVRAGAAGWTAGGGEAGGVTAEESPSPPSLAPAGAVSPPPPLLPDAETTPAGPAELTSMAAAGPLQPPAGSETEEPSVSGVTGVSLRRGDGGGGGGGSTRLPSALWSPWEFQWGRYSSLVHLFPTIFGQYACNLVKVQRISTLRLPNHARPAAELPNRRNCLHYFRNACRLNWPEKV